MHWDPLVVQIAAFAAAASLVALVVTLLSDSDRRTRARLKDLGGGDAGRTAPLKKPAPPKKSAAVRLHEKLEALGSRLVAKSPEGQRSELETRVMQAGIYSTSAVPIIMALRLLLLLVPLLAAAIIVITRPAEGAVKTLLLGGCAGMFGLLAPLWWLDWKSKKRQLELRQSLPDFLDLMVTCLEAGLSFEAALQKVGEELSSAHPLLAREIGIVQRELRLGGTADAALMSFADRSGLDEVRTLASFIQQARRFGASVCEALRTHADMLRTKREQAAEEKAQKASVKVLAPTLLCIFPAVFVVLAGPAVMDLHEKFVSMGNTSEPTPEEMKDQG